jgi:hypothetical protein
MVSSRKQVKVITSLLALIIDPSSTIWLTCPSSFYCHSFVQTMVFKTKNNDMSVKCGIKNGILNSRVE